MQYTNKITLNSFIIIFVLIFYTASAQPCSLNFTSPTNGATVQTQNITVYGVGVAAPQYGDYGTVAATLNGQVIFNMSGSFTTTMSLFATRGVNVTLNIGPNDFVVTGSVGGCSASDAMTVYYLLEKEQNIGRPDECN
jgi:hypothetical protein